MAYEVNAKGAITKVRSPWAPIGLGLITFGIYNLFWYYKINKEMKEYGRVMGDQSLANSEPGMSVLAVTLGSMVLVPAIVSYINTIQRLQRVERLGGKEPLGWGLIVVLIVLSIPTLGLASVAIPYMMQQHLNGIWQQYPPSAMGTGEQSVIGQPADVIGQEPLPSSGSSASDL